MEAQEAPRVTTRALSAVRESMWHNSVPELRGWDHGGGPAVQPLRLVYLRVLTKSVRVLSVYFGNIVCTHSEHNHFS